MKLKQFFLFIIFSLSVNANANGCLDVIVGLSKPPYVLEDQKMGYELELVSDVLARMDKCANYIFVPFGRSEKMLKSDGIDGLLTANANIIKDHQLLSEVYIVYQNVAVSLAERELVINTIEDLSKYSIASFQNAHKILGARFAKASEMSPLYTQVAKQKAQLEILLKGRSDVIVLDINIFNYFLKQYEGKIDRSKISVHNIFSPSPYRMAFNDTSLVPLFNASLAEYKQTSAYQALKAKYDFIKIPPTN